MTRMGRETFRLEEEDIEDIEQLVEKGIYKNKSQAFRDGVKEVLDKHKAKLDKEEDDDIKPWSKRYGSE